jgi:hypothetical protein
VAQYSLGPYTIDHFGMIPALTTLSGLFVTSQCSVMSYRAYSLVGLHISIIGRDMEASRSSRVHSRAKEEMN